MINIRGFPEINGENFPLDIWSLYMQEVAKSLPVEELDSPSSGLELRVKKSGRAVEKPNTAKEKTAETTRESTTSATSGQTQQPSDEQAQPPPPRYSQPQPPPSVYRPPPIYGPSQ
jgi:penicillin-binding protein 1A